MASGHVRELLARAREEQLLPAERDDVHAHLATCPDCAAFDLTLERNERSLNAHEPVIALPRRHAPATTATSRRLWVPIGALGLVAVFALVVGVALGNWRATVASPATPPRPTGPLPSPLAVGHGSVDPGFGFVNTDIASPATGPIVTIRNEVSRGVVTSVRGALPNVAVSLNGQKVAIWASFANPTGTGQSFQLVVYDTIARTWTAPLFTSVSEIPRAILWSSDGTGVVFSTETDAGRGGLVGRQVHTSWFSLDIASAQARELIAFEGLAEHVYSWDRSTDTITASRSVLASPAPTASVASGAFLVLAHGELRSFPIPARWTVGAADSYGRSVVLLAGTTCDDGSLRCPRAEVRDQTTFGVLTPEFALARTPVRDLPTVSFRPRSQDLIVLQTYFSASPTVELWPDLGRGARLSLFQPGRPRPGGGVTATDVNRIITRPDGGAVFLLQFDTSRTGRWFGDLVSLVDANLMGYLDFSDGGNPLGSVVLDRSYAARIDGRTPPPSLCDSYVQAVVPSPGATARYPTGTAQQVRIGLTTADPNFRHLLEDIAGVRQDANPLRDTRVPRCDVGALEIGEPVFVRSYPSSTGLWYVPVIFQGDQLLLATVGRDEAGVGSQGGSIGGSGVFLPSISEAQAKAVAGAPSDLAVSAELVLARPPLTRSSVPAWRVVRASGAVFYVFADPGAGPNGLLLPESQVATGS